MGDFLPVILTTLIVHYTNLSDANMHSSSTIFQSSETKKNRKIQNSNNLCSNHLSPPGILEKPQHLGKRIIDLKVSILRLRVPGTSPGLHSPTSPKKSWVPGWEHLTKWWIFCFFLTKKIGEKKKEKTFLLGSLVWLIRFFWWGVVTFFRWKNFGNKSNNIWWLVECLFRNQHGWYSNVRIPVNLRGVFKNSGKVWACKKMFHQTAPFLHLVLKIYLHPRKLTWIPKMMGWKRYLIPLKKWQVVVSMFDFWGVQNGSSNKKTPQWALWHFNNILHKKPVSKKKNFFIHLH